MFQELTREVLGHHIEILPKIYQEFPQDFSANFQKNFFWNSLRNNSQEFKLEIIQEFPSKFSPESNRNILSYFTRVFPKTSQKTSENSPETLIVARIIPGNSQKSSHKFFQQHSSEIHKKNIKIVRNRISPGISWNALEVHQTRLKPLPRNFPRNSSEMFPKVLQEWNPSRISLRNFLLTETFSEISQECPQK